MDNITIHDFINNLKVNYWVFSYGGCGTNYLRKLLKIFSRVFINKFHTRDERRNYRKYIIDSIHIMTPPKNIKLNDNHANQSGFTAVYIFGNVYNTVLSLIRRKKTRVMKRVINIISNSEYDIKNLTLDKYLKNNKDKFNLIKHFKNWENAKVNYKIIFIRYETLLDNIDKLKIDLNINIDERGLKHYREKRRSSFDNLTSKQQKKIKKMYGTFNDYLNTLPDYWVVKPKK